MFNIVHVLYRLLNRKKNNHNYYVLHKVNSTIIVISTWMYSSPKSHRAYLAGEGIGFENDFSNHLPLPD